MDSITIAGSNADYMIIWVFFTLFIGIALAIDFGIIGKVLHIFRIENRSGNSDNNTYQKRENRNQKNGLNVLATMPTKLIEQGRYDDALQLENMANEAIKGSEMPITVLCLYKAVPENLEDRFSEYHDLIIKRSTAGLQ
ncbi:MAG: hypothetical protein ACJ708_08925 [Nitrososphaeraceae archaeon]